MVLGSSLPEPVITVIGATIANRDRPRDWEEARAWELEDVHLRFYRRAQVARAISRVRISAPARLGRVAYPAPTLR